MVGLEIAVKKVLVFWVQSVMNHLGSFLKETATSDLAAHREGYRGDNISHGKCLGNPVTS